MRRQIPVRGLVKKKDIGNKAEIDCKKPRNFRL